jgi:hypothetical protein
VAGSIYFARESRRAATRDRQRIDALETVDYLKAVNALLRTLASTPDITRSLFELAVRIHAIVPCDRVGLALLTEDRCVRGAPIDATLWCFQSQHRVTRRSLRRFWSQEQQSSASAIGSDVPLVVAFMAIAGSVIAIAIELHARSSP